MRKSREVPLTLLTAVALGAIGCETRHCVDAQNHLLPDSACESSSAPVAGSHFVDGGSSGGHVGDTVVGSSEAGVAHGGFGHGGGEGGE